ncbi:sigma 54-interacting transcriptional regulator [Niallia circulans]|uniref:sigma 54-interacting transcriptional regulator n=1 Tax=Niallia circulans TaxID=1397 RepID=UPI00203E82AC|nr:sigma 54-interacting transcriptional regulator [Niallia circulans]MCM2980849.1 sigma 54-interacting transcriptional regulator [Niallia circulans]
MIDRMIQSTSYTLFDEIKEGIIIIDDRGVISYFNKSAQSLMQNQYPLQIDQHILSVIPNSGMMRVLHTKRIEEQKKFAISEADYLLISRYPLIGKDNNVIGAVAVLQEESQKRQWIDKDSLQMLLTLLLQKSAEAYLVVDEFGHIVMQNSSYKELAVLLDQQNNHQLMRKNREEVIQTRRDAEITIQTDTLCLTVKSTPIMVDGKLKGCLQILHNETETAQLKKELQQTKAIIRGLEQSFQFDDFIYQSPSMNFAIEQAKLAAGSKQVIFIRGEEGTGKFMLANAIHNWSENKFHLFKRIYPQKNREQLRAFLSTMNSLSKGTVYLENITCLSMAEQTSLLNRLKELAQEEKKPSFRLIVSSPIKLEKALMVGDFLEELYDELMKSNIYLPPLRERKEDIYLLAKHFLIELNKENGRWITEIDPEAQKALKNYGYTRNILELKAILQLSVIQAREEDSVLKLEHLALPQVIKKQQAEFQEDANIENQPLSVLVEKYEKVIIEQTLRKLDGNKTLTAKTLGLSVRNLYYKLDKYHLN